MDTATDQALEKETNTGYSLCWDNVQKLSVARHPGDKKNQMMLWAMCFATKNRISFMHEEFNRDVVSATQIPLSNFLPTYDDFENLHKRMVLITKEILVKYFAVFQSCPVETIKHDYIKESNSKSEIVNLGVISENPSTCKGTIQIMKYLHQYVPLYQDGQAFQLLCHGDQLSVERMIDAVLAMACSSSQSDQLAGLVPRPQNFHRRCILLQDSMNLLYSTSSLSEKGSLMQIRNQFHFNNVSKKVMDNVNHVVDFWNFTTEAFLCLLACKFLEISGIDEVPNISDKMARLDALCVTIVDEVWPKIFLTSIAAAINTGSETENPTYDDTDPDATIPYCGDINDEDMDATLPYEEPDLDRTIPYMEDDPETPKPTDHVVEYSKAVVWRGLLHMCQRHAERENNGNHMIEDWRIQSIDFWNLNHNKYLIQSHRLLANINGFLPERLAQELVWNSTANLSGLPGHNVALDLVNEFLNNDFKTNLKDSKGHYTDTNVQRCSRLVGGIVNDIDNIFENIVDKKMHSSKKKDVDNGKAISRFLTLYSAKDLFDFHHDGRSFKGFNQFHHRIEVKNPQKLRERLMKYSRQLDQEQSVLN